MSILKTRRIALHGINRIAILADAACREGWEKNFPRLLKKVWRKYHPQLFIVAGDLALHGTEREYRRVIKHINSIPSLWVAVPGDHDRPLKTFCKYFGSTRKVIDVGKWRFIGINTANRMFLKKEAEWIKNNIRSHSILFSHVPPEANGWTFHSLWPRSSNRFLKVLKQYRHKIKALYCGHIHGFSMRTFLNIPMTVTGAVAESKIVRNNKYAGKGFFEMIIFDVKTGRTRICKMK